MVGGATKMGGTDTSQRESLTPAEWGGAGLSERLGFDSLFCHYSQTMSKSVDFSEPLSPCLLAGHHLPIQGAEGAVGEVCS